MLSIFNCEAAKLLKGFPFAVEQIDGDYDVEPVERTRTDVLVRMAYMRPPMIFRNGDRKIYKLRMRRKTEARRKDSVCSFA